jgi:hypothetical protein
MANDNATRAEVIRDTALPSKLLIAHSYRRLSLAISENELGTNLCSRRRGDKHQKRAVHNPLSTSPRR